MVLDDDAAWRALLSRDARFDGLLFVGVTSTGVYCRPVCRVRTPQRANCRFFASAAAAEAQAFRPCLKCRPEIAPGLSAMDSSEVLAATAARWLLQALHEAPAGAAAGGAAAAAGEDAEVDGGARLATMATRLGISDRHLRRIFVERHGASPRDWIATQRLLLAKQLLTDSALPVTQVALASGFRSLRRFNDAFAGRYRMAPTALRRARRPARSDGPAPAAEPDAGPSLRLAWRPPLDLQQLLGHFGRRAVAGVEVVDAGRLTRTLALLHGGQRLAGWIDCRFDAARHEVRVQVGGGLAPALGLLRLRLRALFDLDADPHAVDALLAGDAVFRSDAAAHAAAPVGTRLPGALDGFEAAVRVVLGQQVTVRAARTLLQRLVDRFGAPLATPHAGLTRLFPDAATIAAADAADIGTLGIVRQRVGALQALAREVAGGRLVLAPGAAVAPTLAALQALPGIGPWSAQLIAARALSWPDAWPASDIGLMTALGTRDPRAVERRGAAWRPWRGYALMRLWERLETGT